MISGPSKKYITLRVKKLILTETIDHRMVLECCGNSDIKKV